MTQSHDSQSAGRDAQLIVDEQISYALSHPGISAWLKHALRSALDRDPIAVLNDLEILSLMLRKRSAQRIAEQWGSSRP